MILNALLWFDIHVMRHRWTWLCSLIWDRQLVRDSRNGTLDRMLRRDDDRFLAELLGIDEETENLS